MKILWLSHLIPYPPKGGVLQRSFNLIKEVAKYHDVHLLAFNQKALLPTDKSINQAIGELKKICKSVQAIPIPSEGKKYGRYLLYIKSIFTPAPFTISWLESDRMEHLVKETVDKYKIDLLHFDTISLAPFSNAVGKCKRVLNHHNIESAIMLRRARNECNLLKKMYIYQEGYKIRRYEKQICKNFDLNITCSRLDSERLLREIPGLKIEEISNGVDLEYFYPLNKEKEEYSLIFAGGMNWYPNGNAMMFFVSKIWPLLKREIPGVKMTVIGVQPPSKLVKLASVDKNFKVTGFVDDVRPFIDKALVYVCPIKDGGGTRLKILDALAMGKAVVADPIACEGIDVIDGESVLIATTPEEYVAKIKLLFSDEILLKKLSKNGRKLILDRYSFLNIGQKFSNLYEIL